MTARGLSDAEWDRVRHGFEHANALDSRSRERWLRELETTDPEVARELRGLLAHADRATGSIGQLAGAAAADWQQASDAETDPAGGTRVGDYRLVHMLGHGGMGEVWEAERADGQFEQRVAIKLIKRGLDSDEVLRRFQLERQILARLDHPGITRLLDGGVLEDGRSYLVMERVHGMPIGDYVRREGAPTSERLRLFLGVCAAVEAAHHALVVHRDLKPSNILVTADGDVKLLDFGIAKLLTSDVEGGRTSLFGAPLTLDYAAPEQVTGEPITTATDVYALGVILFELLTAERPFVRQAQSPSALALALENERVVVPPRATDGTRIDADLAAVLHQALRREPAQRYPTVGALAEDIERYRSGHAVRARAGHHAYRARKFLRRHRLAATAVTLVVIAVLTGAGLALWQARRATREAERARAVERFLTTLFERADPTHTAGERLTGVQLLDEGARRVATELKNAPHTQARMEEVLASSYRGLGHLDAASQHAERAIALHDQLDGPGSLPAAAARLTLAEVLADRGLLEATERALQQPRALLAGDDAEPRLHTRLLVVEGFLAEQRGDLQGALVQARAAASALERALGPDDVDSVLALESLGVAQSAVGSYPEALATLNEVQARLERIGLGESPQSATLRTNRGDLLETLGRLDAAEADLQAAIRILEKAYGQSHPELAQALLKFGFFLSQRRRLDDSDAALRHAAAILESLDHYDLASAWRYLGHNALARERYVEAERLYADAAALYRRKLGPDHNLTWNAVLSLALARARLGRLAEAEQMQRDALAAIERLEGADSPELRAPIKQLGETLRLRGRAGAALELHRRALALERRSFRTDDHIAVAASKRQIALDLLAARSDDGLVEAGTLLDEALGFLRNRPSERARLPEFLSVRALVFQAHGDRAGMRRALDEGLRTAALEPTASPSAVAEMKRLSATSQR